MPDSNKNCFLDEEDNKAAADPESAQTPATREQLFSCLDRLGITHTTVEHAAAHTVEQAQANRGFLPGGHAKNLFLKCKKGQLFLIVAQEDTSIRLNQLHKRLGSGRLSFGSSDLMMEVLGIEPGSVTPFALLNDKERRVKLILDETLMHHNRLNFHPLDNTATTTISQGDLLLFLEKTGAKPTIMDLNPDE